ncbi:Tctex-1 family [Lotmaria passim]
MTSEFKVGSREAFTMPRPEAKFSVHAVERVIQEVCEKMVGLDRTYVYEEAQPLIKDLCAEIQQRLVRLGYERYKLVTHATVTEAANQGMRIASRCLWDPETDNYASFTYTNEYMHVSVVVFGVYWE